MRLISLLAGACIALLVAAAVAQNTQRGTPTHVRGTVEKFDGQILVVKSREGQDARIMLVKDFKVAAVAKADIADIKRGDFIGSAAMQGADGRLHAQEVLIFPEAVRGTGEGHYPWDLTPGSTMTNATVAEVVSEARGRLLTVKYNGGEKEIEVPPNVPIVTPTPGDSSLSKPGTAVFIPALKKPDGTFVADFVAAGKDGVKPPM
jgi:hypothetical protein